VKPFQQKALSVIGLTSDRIGEICQRLFGHLMPDCHFTVTPYFSHRNARALHLSRHISATLSGFLICNVTPEMAESSIIRNSLFLPWFGDSPFSRTCFTVCLRKSVAIVATSSTCANFRPGGPSPHATKVPSAGSFRDSSPATDGYELEVSQRPGRQASGSGPQCLG